MKKQKTTAFTLATPNYLAHAYSLRDSFLRHNAGDEFIICIVGKKEQVPGKKEYQFVYLDQLADKRIQGMTGRYNPFELSAALKPFFADHIFSHFKDIDRLIYLDGDTRVFGTFKKVTDAAICISPHRTENLNYLPGFDNFSVISLLRYGVYNTGYFELIRNPVSMTFLNWWQSLMENHAYDRPEENLFTDQLWLSAVPSFFDDYFINKNPGYNAAFWNLLERAVTKNNDQWLVNGQPLVFFHFAKYDIEKPEKMVNFDHPFLSFSRFPELKTLFDDYREALREAGYAEFKNLPHPYPYSKRKKRRSWWKNTFWGRG